MLNNEKEEGSTTWSIRLRKLKLVQHCIQLTIAKNKFISKTAVTFLVFDSTLLTVTVLHKSCKIVFVYISQINLSDSSATQWVFNLKSQSKS